MGGTYSFGRNSFRRGQSNSTPLVRGERKEEKRGGKKGKKKARWARGGGKEHYLLKRITFFSGERKRNFRPQGKKFAFLWGN